MPTFDIVSEIDQQEIRNAVDQAGREVATRFDFKGTGSRFDLKEMAVTLHAPAEFQLRQMLDILKLKIAKRGIHIGCLDVQDPVQSGQAATQVVNVKHGIDTDTGRKIQKLIKESGLKVQAAIQGEQVRVTGKKRDDLQSAITRVRAAEMELPLQFNNFRD